MEEVEVKQEEAPININILPEEEEVTVDKPLATPELVKEWYALMVQQNLAYYTLNNYNSFIKRFVGEGIIITQRRVDKFRDTHLNTMSSGALKSFFRFLVYRKHFPDYILNIRFEKNKTSHKPPKYISFDEMQRIVSLMPSIQTKILTKTIYHLAMRVEEAYKLNWKNFKWDEWLKDKNGYGYVQILMSKRGSSRNLPVHPELMKDLYNNHKERDEFGVPFGGLVFGNSKELRSYLQDKNATIKLTKKQQETINYKHYLHVIKQAYRDLLEDISVKAIGRKITPHVLRHAKAQWLLNNGMSIEGLQSFLGHASIATTQIYAKASPERVKRELELYDNFINKPISPEDIKPNIQQDKTKDERIAHIPESREVVLSANLDKPAESNLEAPELEEEEQNA